MEGIAVRLDPSGRDGRAAREGRGRRAAFAPFLIACSEWRKALDAMAALAADPDSPDAATWWHLACRYGRLLEHSQLELLATAVLTQAPAFWEQAAMEILQRIAAAGHFEDITRRGRLMQEPDLAALRQTEAVAAFLALKDD